MWNILVFGFWIFNWKNNSNQTLNTKILEEFFPEKDYLVQFLWREQYIIKIRSS